MTKLAADRQIAGAGASTPRVAYDRLPLSDQYTDEDGRLYYTGQVISRAVVNPYFGREIPNWHALGLAPDRIYQLYRDPAEIAKAVRTFNGIQVMDDHIHVRADAPQKDKVVGSVGTNAVFDAPDLRNDIAIWYSDAIERIKSGQQRELSCSYYYDAVMEPGDADGTPYDGRMTNIRGNHVALVKAGRVGPDAALDAALKGEPMAYKRNAARMIDYLQAEIAAGKIAKDASPDALKAAIDADPEDETEEERKAREAKEKEANDAKAAADAKAAKDAEESCEKRARELVGEDEKLGFEGLVKKLVDEGHSEESAKKIAGKVAVEKGDDKAMSKKTAEDAAKVKAAADAAMKAAVDAAILAERKRNAEANEARALVRPLVGDVIGMDSAEEILAYALKEKGVAVDGINAPGLKALVSSQIAAATPRRQSVANDAAVAADISKRYGVAAPRKL